MLSEEERKSLIDYRYEKAEQSMKEAISTAELGYWSLTAQRLYYAAYYAVTAKLLEKQVSAKTHAGVITMLNMHLVKHGTLPQEYAIIYAHLFRMRQKGDYDDYFDHKEEDVRPMIEQTRKLIDMVKLQ